MSTQYFMPEVITAEEYVGYVRTIFQLHSAVNMVGLDGGIQVVNNRLRFYNSEDEDVTPEYKDLKRLGVDINLLVKHNNAISDCIICLDTTITELYDKVCHAIVEDYGSIARYYRANEDKNIVPSFVFLREFDNQDESDKVKLLYEYQYLYDYINNLCNMNTNRGMDDTIMTQYDVDRDCVNFVIQHTSVDAVTPNTIVRDNIVIRLLSTVVFSGSHVIKVRDVLNNIDTVIRYLIRLYADSFRVAYHGLKDATDNVIHGIGLQTINYVTENNGFVVFGDNVFSVYVDSGRVKHLVSRLDYVNKVDCFIKAIESHKYLLNTPIIDNYVTVASAIQSYLRYQYESVVGSSGYKYYMPYVCLLLSATSVSSVGYAHIHQSYNMYLIHYRSYMVDTNTSDRLDMMLSYIDFCKDNYQSDFAWFNENHTMVVNHKHKEDEVLSLHKYIDDNSIGIILDVDDVLDLLKLSRSLVKSFYNTLNTDKHVVFIDALNGFRMISDIANTREDKHKYIRLDYEVDKYLNCNTNYMGTIDSDTLLCCSDMVFPLYGKYCVKDVNNYKPIVSIVEKRYKGMEVVLRLILNKLFIIFEEIEASDIKTVSIGVEDFKDYSKLSFLVKTYDGRVETYPLHVADTFGYAVYSLFHEDSGYQIYDATLKEVYDILSEVMSMMVTSFNFVEFDEDIFVVVDSLRTLSVIVDNLCDTKKGEEKMKVVHTKETELVRSSESRNLMLAKDLAIEFINSGYDVIMRDGEDLVVYSNDGNSLQEYVPKSLHSVFYDVDKLDLLPLTYYVYMCK